MHEAPRNGTLVSKLLLVHT